MGKGAVGDWDGKKQQRVNLHIYRTNMYGTLPPPPNKEMKKKMLPLPKSNHILIKLFMHLAQLSVLTNQLYFIPIEISGNQDYQKKKKEERKFCKSRLF